MGYASYEEDILKRHESDVHDIMRELEVGHLGVAKQKHVLPEFRWVLDQLRAVLSDPKHPIATRMLQLKARTFALENDLRILTEKRETLSLKNSKLNERVVLAEGSLVEINKNFSRLKRDYKLKTAETQNLSAENSALKLSIKKLEHDLLQTQVDLRY